MAGTPTSGLTVMNAFTALQSKSEEAFADFALSIKARSGGGVTFKTAADIAQKLTVGLFAHIYQQVEVMHLGEAARAMKIAEEYGQRLDLHADNLFDSRSLGTLIAGYPSHSFVIDMKEAAHLFKRVREISVDERKVCDALGHLSRIPSDGLNEPVYFLSDPVKPDPGTQAQTNDAQQTDRTDTAGQESGAQGTPDPPASAVAADQAAAGSEVVHFRCAAAVSAPPPRVASFEYA